MDRFRDLKNGDTFFFVVDNWARDSFFERCVKLSPRTYTTIEGESAPKPIRVSTIDAEVFDVERAS